MHQGLDVGESSTVSTVVTDSMVARLGGQKIHPVLATAQMIEWMEWAGRRLILPYLEDGEDAVGYAIDIVHNAPTLVGESFTATAAFRKMDNNRIVAEVRAENSRGVIGEGVFVQVLVSKHMLSDRIAKIQAAHQAQD